MIIKPYTNKQLTDKIEEFYNLGGCIEFKVFDVEKEDHPYSTHFEIAKRTILEIENDLKSQQHLNKENNINALEKSGVQISIKQFLGPQFDLLSYKPLIKGVSNFYNDYFYYDTPEQKNNIINFKAIAKEFDFQENDGTSLAFCGAFLEPPYSIEIGGNIFERGKYFLDFCDLMFSNLSKIEIYKWSIDCSSYFDAGKEWWGSHFWTIYNPVKKIYIGAVASATD